MPDDVWLLVLVVAVASTASAQLVAAKDGPIVYGHHHFNVTSVDEHRKFWTTIGGTAIKIGVDNDREIIRFPNVLVFMTARPPKGGTKADSTAAMEALAQGSLSGDVALREDAIAAAAALIVRTATSPPSDIDSRASEGTRTRPVGALSSSSSAQ